MKFLMVGDSIKTDIRFALNCLIDSVLVLSGVTKSGENSGATYVVEHI